jgi:hypothetical protein
MAKNSWNNCMVKLLAAGIFALVSTGIAKAQEYPVHPITMIVPFAAGGPTDTLARILAQRMSVKLGQASSLRTCRERREVSASAVSLAPRRMAIR